MGLTLKVECSYHQLDDDGYGREIELDIDSLDSKSLLKVRRELKKDGWVVQFNGDHMDTYCSKKCAE